MSSSHRRTDSRDEYTIAIIGMGPRGIAVLEHLALHFRKGDNLQRVRILAIDDTQVGAGRIWRTDQPDWLMMNTITSQVTMFSGSPDSGPARPGAGLSLYEWLANQPDAGLPRPTPNDYAPRVVYGKYLQMVYESIVSDLPRHVRIESVHARVVSLHLDNDAHVLTLADGRELPCIDKIVLTTGHPQNHPEGRENQFEQFAKQHPGLAYIAGNSAADMALDTIAPDSTVGIIGMGLGFYDILLSLTVGRGGKFDIVGNGLRYRASGCEPKIVAGSRSGVPILARGINQKPVGRTYRPLFLTPEAIQDARIRTVAFRGSERLDFQRDVFPFIRAEVDHVYFRTHVRLRHGPMAAERFAEAHVELVHRGDLPDAAFLREHGVSDVRPIDLYALARPFAGHEFGDGDAYRTALIRLMRDDLAEAQGGNVDSPLKAALDVLRDVRDIIRTAVDFGGLHPYSYRDDFLGAFGPVCSLLSAGPPAQRVEQAIALMEAGILDVAGPDTNFSCDEERLSFYVSSTRVQGSGTDVSVLIDSRVPTTCLRNDASPLIRTLLANGLIREYVIDDGFGHVFETGGLAVTDAPFHVIDADGRPNPACYALGIPTEHTRWFTQVGSDTPNACTRFGRDADAIAADIYRSLLQPRSMLSMNLTAL